MTIETLTRFFMWCTILSGALYAISAIMLVAAPGWVYGMQSRWFPISREAFNVAIYAFLGLFKVLLLVFNVVPFVALLIVG